MTTPQKRCKTFASSQNVSSEDFPSGPMVKTLSYQYREHRFDPWQGNQDPTCRVAQPKIFKKEENFPGQVIPSTRKGNCCSDFHHR